VKLVLVVVLAVVLAACGSGGGFPDAPDVNPDPDPGTFGFSWMLTDATGHPTTCAQAGATVIRVSITDEATGDVDSALFACSLGDAVSGALFPSTYDLAFTLDGMTGALATAPTQTGVVIQSNRTTQLPNAVVFVIGS